ncbi:MAG: hypothetical protein IJD58_12130 [Lachnospiraceae bacterium]|nr:hypothetical protein [Tyzzerella sp.]MBQ2982851.1 hypothetical protein [Lachnospiraceae bacterium]
MGRENVSGYETSENLLPDYRVIESELGVDSNFFWDLDENISGSLGFSGTFLGMPDTIQVRVKAKSCKGRKAASNQYSRKRTESCSERKRFSPTYSSGKITIEFGPENTEGNKKPRNCDEHEEADEKAGNKYHRSVMFTVLLPEVIWVLTEEFLGTVR